MSFNLLKWVETRMNQIMDTPYMWGPIEAIESQLLMSLELKACFLDMPLANKNPRYILDLYQNHLRHTFPGEPSSTLSLKDLTKNNEQKFLDTLIEFTVLTNAKLNKKYLTKENDL